MTSKPRLFEVNVGDVANFGNNAALGTLADVPAGDYLVTAKLVAVTSASAYSAQVSCTSDGDDDMLGVLTIVATRVD